MLGPVIRRRAHRAEPASAEFGKPWIGNALGALDRPMHRAPGGFDRDRPPQPIERQPLRSEEHTSELQSLMRISYAVFCLKKKKTITFQLHPIVIMHEITINRTYTIVI